MEKPFSAWADSSFVRLAKKRKVSTRTEKETSEDGRSEVGDGIFMLF